MEQGEDVSNVDGKTQTVEESRVLPYQTNMWFQLKTFLTSTLLLIALCFGASANFDALNGTAIKIIPVGSEQTGNQIKGSLEIVTIAVSGAVIKTLKHLKTEGKLPNSTSNRADGKDATNRGVSRTDFDQRFSGKFSNHAEADEAFKQYEIAKNADSEIVLGRLPDTEAGAQLGMTRLDSGNWTPNVNDSFIQGGIHAGKPFYLGSNPDISNYRAAWNALEGNRGNYPQTVFFREMKQLRDAGYRLVGDNMLPPN